MMKRFILIWMVCMIVVAACLGCGTEEKKTENDMENRNDLTDDGSVQVAFQNIARVENGFYFIKNACLCFYDEGLKKATILCTNAGCEHNSKQCNAFLYRFDQQHLYGYENEVYGIETDYEEETDLLHYYLTRISKDGTTRTRLVDLFQNPNGKGVSYNIIQHRGYCYFAINEDSYDEKKEGIVYRAKLEKGAKVETVYKDSGYGITYFIHGYGDSVYIEEDKCEDAKQQKHTSVIWMYALENKKISQVMTGQIRAFTVADGVFFYMKDDGIWKLEGKKPQKFYDLGQELLGDLWYDGTYLCFDTITDYFAKGKDTSGRKVYVIDQTGTLVNCPTVSKSCLFVGKAKDRCIWQDLMGQIYLSGNTEIKEQTWNVSKLKIEGIKEESH